MYHKRYSESFFRSLHATNKATWDAPTDGTPPGRTVADVGHHDVADLPSLLRPPLKRLRHHRRPEPLLERFG